jgi:hypothetical protein
MNFIKRLMEKRYELLQRKRNKKKYIEQYIKKHGLDCIHEQRRVIKDANKLVEGYRGFGRKYRRELKEKVNFMIEYQLIKVK